MKRNAARKSVSSKAGGCWRRPAPRAQVKLRHQAARNRHRSSNAGLVGSVTKRTSSGCRCAAAVSAFTPLNRKNSWRRWRERWPFDDLHWLGQRWVEPDMEDVFTAYSQGYNALLKPLTPNEIQSPSAPSPAWPTKNSSTSIGTGASLLLLLILPPVFTLIFGHAFEVGDLTDVPGLARSTPMPHRGPSVSSILP